MKILESKSNYVLKLELCVVELDVAVNLIKSKTVHISLR